MRTKSVLLAVIVILSVVSLAVTGLYADFSDIETTEDNYLKTAELNLRLENPQGIGEQWEESVLRTWHFEQKYPVDQNPDEGPWYGRMQPGDIVASSVSLKADGTVDGNTIDIYCSNVNEELDMDTDIENERENELLGYPDPPIPRDPNNGIYDKDTKMIILSMYYNWVPIIWGEGAYYTYFTDMNGDNRISLDEFEKQPLIGMTPVPDSGPVVFFMTVEFAEDAGDEYQGDRTNMTLMFALMQ